MTVSPKRNSPRAENLAASGAETPAWLTKAGEVLNDEPQSRTPAEGWTPSVGLRQHNAVVQEPRHSSSNPFMGLVHGALDGAARLTEGLSVVVEEKDNSVRRRDSACTHG